MNVKTIKFLLATQEKSYIDSLQVFLDQVFTKINEISKVSIELMRSLDCSKQEIDEMKGTLQASWESRERLPQNRLGNTVEDQHAYTNVLDDGSRRNYLRIDGLEETPWEIGKQSIVKV